ncbi:hypothetical protein NDU88_002773 [Pleurodeles waltl]|uniref:Uncharacterized protein n=1 Tax=Pleurodeles waltl TaxID=8319 RepID=A0AAV7L004_PLEWA|nr:hypothetical protein NDU88_002773 [Pleurodeles waltl]
MSGSVPLGAVASPALQQWEKTADRRGEGTPEGERRWSHGALSLPLPCAAPQQSGRGEGDRRVGGGVVIRGLGKKGLRDVTAAPGSRRNPVMANRGPRGSAGLGDTRNKDRAARGKGCPEALRRATWRRASGLGPGVAREATWDLERRPEDKDLHRDPLAGEEDWKTREEPGMHR